MTLRPPPTPDHEGLRVILKRMPGYTPKDLLQQFFYFQVPPLENFKHAHGHDQQSYETLRGEFSRPGGRRLITIQFTTMVLDWTPEWSLLHGEGYQPEPIDITRNLIKLCESGLPVPVHRRSARALGALRHPRPADDDADHRGR